MTTILCTSYYAKVEEEIALQWLCLGNGKRSPYLYGAMLLGAFILPEYYKYYIKSYHIGKQANTFHHYNYKALLKVNFNDFRAVIFFLVVLGGIVADFSGLILGKY